MDTSISGLNHCEIKEVSGGVVLSALTFSWGYYVVSGVASAAIGWLMGMGREIIIGPKHEYNYNYGGIIGGICGIVGTAVGGVGGYHLAKTREKKCDCQNGNL